MSIRILPDSLINQISAGEVIERPANVVKELIENSIDAGADDIIIKIEDGGRTKICVIDNGCGMTKKDLLKSLQRHATSKLPNDDLLNIKFMGFRGEAIPSIASVSDMTIDTYNENEKHGWSLNCSNFSIKPSSWEKGTRINVLNLFSKVPARLKFLRTDRAEMLSIIDVVKNLAMSKPDIGFNLNDRWIYKKNQNLKERLEAVMGNDVIDRMLYINSSSKTSNIKLIGFISEPTFHKSSSIEQYLFVNNRPVKDKLLIGALRAAYMDVMHSREYPVCALYLNLDISNVDVNVSPSKTEVHFLEPNHIRAFIIKSLKDKIAETMIERFNLSNFNEECTNNLYLNSNVLEKKENIFYQTEKEEVLNNEDNILHEELKPLGRVIGQFNKKYIIAQKEDNLIIIDQHAAHERLVYEKLRTRNIKVQELLTPIIVNLKKEDILAILELKDELLKSCITIDEFGFDSIAIFSKPADWDLDWNKILKDMADEIKNNGYSSIINEKLHLKLANYACHHSVRAGQKLDLIEMDKLLRDIENTERAMQCNHGRPVYKIIPISELDSWFERI